MNTNATLNTLHVSTWRTTRVTRRTRGFARRNTIGARNGRFGNTTPVVSSTPGPTVGTTGATCVCSGAGINASTAGRSGGTRACGSTATLEPPTSPGDGTSAVGRSGDTDDSGDGESGARRSAAGAGAMGALTSSSFGAVLPLTVGSDSPSLRSVSAVSSVSSASTPRSSAGGLTVDPVDPVESRSRTSAAATAAAGTDSGGNVGSASTMVGKGLASTAVSLGGGASPNLANRSRMSSAVDDIAEADDAEAPRLAAPAFDAVTLGSRAPTDLVDLAAFFGTARLTARAATVGFGALGSPSVTIRA